MKAAKNNTLLAGQRASQTETHGPFSRFALYAIHTRFDAVEWVVEDTAIWSPGGLPEIVVQTASEKEARRALKDLVDAADFEYANWVAPMPDASDFDAIYQ